MISNESSRGARKWKAIACCVVSVDHADNRVARAGGRHRRDSEFWRENPSSE
jgi:hypothetical protein